MGLKARILTPEGEIIKALMEGPYNTTQILNKVSLGKSTVYNNLKDLLLAGWVVRNGDSYRVTDAGVKAYLSEVLPDVNADFIIELGGRAGFSPLKVIELGVRVLQAIDEASYLPADLVRLLARYDPSLLENLQELFGSRPGGAGPNQVAEVAE